ncbi:GEVED domain-containing protein [Psychroserpens sp.]|uniref:GEVED domain-containing protein n=1 Tax=Psychroserpens sp. TaxID=2020870 RepID=UPI00385D2CB5
MNYKSLTSICFFILTLNFINAQECGFDKELEKRRQNPTYLQQEQEFEQKIQNYMLPENMQGRMSGNVITIPVVVHVLHLGEAIGSGTNISDAQIQSSIDNLNDFYRGQTAASPVDFEIEFALAQRDPNCNATTGINRINASAVPNYASDGVSFLGVGADENVLKDLSRWPETDYFNVWIVTEIDGNNGGSGFQGYANFYNGNAYEGSVMMYSVFGYDPTNANPSWPLNFARDNSTVSHEAGHYFHLYHTFQGDKDNMGNDQCPLDATVGTDSDGCADTVPHQRETSTCPATNFCDNGNPWADNNTINNIMSYYSCTDLMTNDQKTRARAAMEGTALANSKGDEPVDPLYAAPVVACTTNSPAANNFAGIFSVELNGNTFNSFTTGSDGGNLDFSSNCSNYFEIDASVSNTLNVGVGGNFNQLGVWIDWNDDGDFDDDMEQQHYSQDIPGSSVVGIVLSYPSVIPYGDYVRLRTVLDLDDRYGPGIINSACYQSLVYGQSEDYAIYIQPSTGPTTYTYNNGWLPSDPNGVATASEDITIVSGNASISSNTTCNSLTVNAGAGLTIDSATTLTVSNGLTLESSSTSYSSLILDGSVTGTINYERHVNINGSGETGSNDLISAPLTGQEFDDFVLANPNILNNGSLYLFGPYDKTTGDYITLNGASTTTLDAGVGYRAASSDNDTFTFTGTANNTVITQNITNSGPAEAEWNLVGNPYPSYLNVQAFLNHEVSSGVNNINLMNTGTAAIYGYDGSAQDGWIIYNLANTSASTVIAPGQGFFVSADPTNVALYDLEFSPAMRSTGTSDDFILGRSSTSNTSVLSKLLLSSSSNTSSTSIYFIEGTSKGLDNGYDASTYKDMAGDFSIFTNLVDNNDGLDIVIQ